MRATLFEVSWEVCHKLGGIHTVVSSKARRMTERLGDSYVLIGPWLLSAGEVRDFEDDPAHAAFAEGCRAAGVPVRVGRWNIPGRPRTILVEFSGLYQQKDDLLRELWEKHRVDSLFGGWDYAEPVMFGIAASMVIERWWREIAQGAEGPAVAHFHEWMTGAGLLRLADHVPEVGTVFTAHATVLGRTLASSGVEPLAGLGDRTPEKAAEEAGVRAMHSLEAAAARKADVFTTVSEVAGDEARVFHGRSPDPVLPNGWDEAVLRERIGGVTRKQARASLRSVASKILGEDVKDAFLVVSSGRYEFRNKGFDLLLDAAGDLNARAGRPIVLFLFVPAGNGGLRREVVERLQATSAGDGPLGICTHALFDAEKDPIAAKCREAGLDNRKGARVRVIHVASYLGPDDGLFGKTYESLVQGADLTVFPSYYDAWGYTPQESLALGVPTITTDCTGFGRWMQGHGTPKGHGVTVLRRRDRSWQRVRAALAGAVERHFEGPREDEKWSAWCRDLAAKTEWAHLLGRQQEAHHRAGEAARSRSRGRIAPPAAVLPPRPPASPTKPRIFSLDVAPVLPAAIRGLEELVRNWRWTWDPEAVKVLRSLSPATWVRVGHDPRRLLREAPAADLEVRARDAGYVARVREVLARHRAYLEEPVSEAASDGPSARHPVAYICAEYGIHESLPIYSGGLGVLAGDHLKSASDLRLPLVAVGLLYRRGYMRQRLDGGTEQAAVEEPVDPAMSALEPVVDAEGRPVEVSIALPGTTLAVRAWKAAVGRVPLYLLDTDVEANRPENRGITHQLYGGDSEMRVRQEIVLGFGGVRLLAALGLDPACWHVNEGHGAFAALERMRFLLRDRGLAFEEAREVVRGTTAFTTHTPVPAGHDRFSEDLMRRYFSDVSDWLKVPWERFLGLGATAEDPSGFNMTKLAVEFAGRTNAVSMKHRDVTRGLLQDFCPGLLEEEVPVGSVTNGVHVGGWTAPEIAALVASPTNGHGPPTGEDFRQRAESLDPAVLWKARTALRRRFLDEVRARLERAASERGDAPRLVSRQVEGLDDDALLVGFARRFATYKRADLILRDPVRLRVLLDSGERPVRLFFAGKAHPRDTAARELLSRVAHLARSDEFAGRVFVLENYDLALARTLVAGVDVWLNNPRAPLEASGTSGMKAACNGVLNLSIGDGWWLEAFDGTNGWRIGDDTQAASEAAQDAHDGGSLFALLEHEVVPLFFERDASGVPAGWVKRVRRCLATIPPVFDTARMVGEYRDTAYRPLARRFHALMDAQCAPARTLASRRARLHKGLEALRFVTASVAGAESAKPGDVLTARVDLALGELTAGDVAVELVVGTRIASGSLRGVTCVALPPAGPREGDVQRFEGSWTVPGAGSFGYGLRVRPRVVPDDGAPGFHDTVLWA
jgi:phosphorylase/glycogen(starch) synthase